MCSFLNNLFTVTGNNNTMYSKNRIGNRNVHCKLQNIVFQINSISLIESEEFREISNRYSLSHDRQKNLRRMSSIEESIQEFKYFLKAINKLITNQ